MKAKKSSPPTFLRIDDVAERWRRHPRVARVFRYEANLNGSWPNSQAPLCERQVIRVPDGVGISVDDIPLTIACAAFNSGKAKTIDEALAIVPGVHGIGCERVTKKK